MNISIEHGLNKIKLSYLSEGDYFLYSAETGDEFGSPAVCVADPSENKHYTNTDGMMWGCVDLCSGLYVSMLPNIQVIQVDITELKLKVR